MQDDGHIFCTPDQLQLEIRGFLDLLEAVLAKFGFAKFEINLSTRPESSIGTDEVWERAENALSEALNDKGWPFTIDEGGGAFYGPKIDIKIQVCAAIHARIGDFAPHADDAYIDGAVAIAGCVQLVIEMIMRVLCNIVCTLCRMRLGASGSALPYSSTSTCPSASICITSTRTTRSSAPSCCTVRSSARSSASLAF